MSTRSHSQAQTTSETSHTSPAKGLLQHSHQQPEETNEQEKVKIPSFPGSTFNGDFSQVPVHNTPRIQPKLRLGQPGDRFEEEADQVARQVMRAPNPMMRIENSSPPGNHNYLQERLQKLELGQEMEEEHPARMLQPRMMPPGHLGDLISRYGEKLQRQEVTEEEDTEEILQPKILPGYGDKLQRQEITEEDESEEILQAKTAEGKIGTVSPSIESNLNISRGKGQPLPKPTRDFMESRFGADFSGVRVHTDDRAVQMNKELRAQAFTYGEDIYYGAGKSPGNDELTAHELTHTIQQTGGIQAKIIAKSAKKLNKVVKKSNLSLQMKEMPGNEVNQESQAVVENTEAQPAVEADNPEVVTSPETANAEAVAPPSQETQDNTPNSEEKPETSLEATPQERVTEEVNQESAATPTQTTPTSPESDPDFQAVVAKAKGVASNKKHHAPANTKAQEAQAAAESPASEIESKAQANQVGEMEKAPTPGFNAAAFKAKLMEQIAKAAPQTLEEADEFKDSNKLASVKGEMGNQVKEEQTASQAPLEEKAQQAPDTSSIEAKSVTPLPANEAGEVSKNINAHKAIPKARGQSEIEAPLQENSQKLDQQMAEADVTTEQLANSNEPQFQAALGAKTEAQTNASQASQGYRQFEENQLSQAKGEATATAGKQLEGMHGSRAQLFAQVINQQGETKGKDEQERAKIAGDIQKIYSQTKTKVEEILNGIDSKVNQEFEIGANQATTVFQNYVDERMEAYKDERYDGITGAGRWLKDKLFDLPSEVNAFYREGRQLYLAEMDVVLNNIVNIIGTALTDAKAEIAKGKQEIQEYVAKLPENLQKVGEQAATDIQGQFDELEQRVDSKQDELINNLAQQYNEKLQVVDARIDEMKAANQGLVDKAAHAITGVIDTIKKLKEMLLSVLSKAAAVIDNIIKDPIGFLGNLVKGVKQGFNNFAANIGKHLQAGLIGWLTGTLGPIGIQIPDDIFSLPGIFSLVTQVLGLTWDFIRSKAVKLFGEPVVAGMEKTVEIFQIVRDRGAMGLWEHVKEQFGDLKQTVIEEIKNMVVTQVITAGVKWVLSLLNPASAFVKAAMAIYDIIMFFVNRGSQVLELVNAVVDAVSAIASGAVDGAAKLVENALAKAVPVVIGFLASLLGIGGLAKKVEGIVSKIRQRIDKAIEKVLLKAKGLFKGKKGKKKSNKGDAKKIKEENKNVKAENITAKDKQKHKAIGEKIKNKLKQKPQKNESFEEFYKTKKNKAEALEDKYQPQLKKGINLDIEFKPVSEDKKDGDIDVAIKIAPNNYYTTFDLDTKDDEARFSELLYKALKEVGEAHHIGGRKSDFETKGTDIKKTDFSEEAKKQEEEDLAADKEKKEDEIENKSKGIHQEISKAQNAYTTASKATIVPNNTFAVGSGKFFVETHDNYYILPKSVGIDNFQYKIKGKNKILADVLRNEVEDRQKQIEREKSTLIDMKEKASDFIKKGKKIPLSLKNNIDNKKLKIEKLENSSSNNSELENLASATTMEGKREQVEFITDKLDDPNYQHIKNIKKDGGQVKIYVNNKIVKQYDYHSNPISIDEAKNLYKGFPGSISSANKKLTVFLASLLAEPPRSSVAHITNMLLLNEKSELSQDSTKPTKLDNKENSSVDITDNKSKSLYVHTSMTQPGSDPTRERTKDYDYDTRLNQGENNKPTNINVSNRDLAAIKHNPYLKQELLDHFIKNKNSTNKNLIKDFKEKIEKYLGL